MRLLRRVVLAGLFAAVGFAGLAAWAPAVAPLEMTSSVSAMELVDINTATPAQLKALPGIGDAYAKRIIDGRPYTAKNQLVTRGILTRPTYDKIAPMIIAKHPQK